MIGLGVQQSNILIKLVGAGNMFTGIEDGSVIDVGRGILTSTLLALTKVGLIPHSQTVGGKLGRSVKFSVSSGLIQVGLTNGESVIL